MRKYLLGSINLYKGFGVPQGNIDGISRYRMVNTDQESVILNISKADAFNRNWAEIMPYVLTLL